MFRLISYLFFHLLVFSSKPDNNNRNSTQRLSRKYEHHYLRGKLSWLEKGLSNRNYKHKWDEYLCRNTPVPYEVWSSTWFAMSAISCLQNRSTDFNRILYWGSLHRNFPILSRFTHLGGAGHEEGTSQNCNGTYKMSSNFLNYAVKWKGKGKGSPYNKLLRPLLRVEV